MNCMVGGRMLDGYSNPNWSHSAYIGEAEKAMRENLCTVAMKRAEQPEGRELSKNGERQERS